MFVDTKKLVEILDHRNLVKTLSSVEAKNT